MDCRCCGVASGGFTWWFDDDADASDIAVSAAFGCATGLLGGGFGTAVIGGGLKGAVAGGALQGFSNSALNSSFDGDGFKDEVDFEDLITDAGVSGIIGGLFAAGGTALRARLNLKGNFGEAFESAVGTVTAAFGSNIADGDMKGGRELWDQWRKK